MVRSTVYDSVQQPCRVHGPLMGCAPSASQKVGVRPSSDRTPWHVRAPLSQGAPSSWRRWWWKPAQAPAGFGEPAFQLYTRSYFFLSAALSIHMTCLTGSGCVQHISAWLGCTHGGVPRLSDRCVGVAEARVHRRVLSNASYILHFHAMRNILGRR
jgi:hypothetical protein